ncbi:MAG: isochorismatase family protein [Betaproteobacteria bacterium]|nr:MAG: isochorismatase family protein [Betaproteobacteria bacterium]
MLIDAGRSQLLVIDFQEKMLPALADGATLLAHCCWVIAAAQKIGVPVAATEQYPKGLGPLVPEIRELLQPEAIAEKARFSAVAAQCLANLPGSDRAQVIVIGVEAHVCVLQTAIDLYHEGKEVFLVADCVGSRAATDRDLAIARMRQEGVRIVSREMVVFEWLGEAGTALFRAVNKAFLK